MAQHVGISGRSTALMFLARKEAYRLTPFSEMHAREIHLVWLSARPVGYRSVCFCNLQATPHKISWRIYLTDFILKS